MTWVSKYVVVKGRFGLGGRIAVVLSAWQYARQTGRELVVDWNDQAYFEPSIVDTYAELFSNPSTTTQVDELEGLSVWPSQWTGKLCAYRNENAAEIMPYDLSFDSPPLLTSVAANEADVVVVTRPGDEDFTKLYQDLALSTTVTDRLGTELRRFDPTLRVGVQIRHGNGERMLQPPDTSWFHRRLQSTTPIFLATDSADIADEFYERYVDVRTVEKWYPPTGAGSLHQNPLCPDRFENAISALLDIWLLSMCSSLIICKGFFGETARALSPDVPFEQYPARIHPTIKAKSAANWENPI